MTETKPSAISKNADDIKSIKDELSIIQVYLFCILAILAMIFISLTKSNASEWTGDEIAAEVAWQALHLVDWGTTRNIAMDPEHYQEVGPVRLLIGKHPSTQKVDIAMGLSAILHPIITNWLPRKSSLFGYQVNPREMWQYFSIGTTGYCVINNLSIGLHVKF